MTTETDTEPNVSVPQVGVAVFGRDGRLLLHTPRFAELLEGAVGTIEPRCELADVLRPLGGDPPASGCPVPFGVPLPGLHWGTTDGRAIDIAFEQLPRDRCCMTVTDVTAARTAQDELRRAREAAEAANRAKSTFLATMTHELRTPLHAVIGFSDALTHEAQDYPGRPVDPALVSEFATAILEAGQHLLQRINTILDVARIESGRFTLAADLIDVEHMLQSCVRTASPAAQAASVTLTIGIETGLPRLRGDERRLRQVIGHLLSNALKFSPASGDVSISAACAADGDLEIAVNDNGIGIAPGDIEHIFDPFNQVDTSLARRTSGTGLGLYSSRSLVAAHGGAIRLDSTPGRGTTAIVRLPRARLMPLPPPPEISDDAPQEPSQDQS